MGLFGGCVVPSFGECCPLFALVLGSLAPFLRVVCGCELALCGGLRSPLETCVCNCEIGVCEILEDRIGG